MLYTVQFMRILKCYCAETVMFFNIPTDDILAIVKTQSDSPALPSAICKKLFRCKSAEKNEL